MCFSYSSMLTNCSPGLIDCESVCQYHKLHTNFLAKLSLMITERAMSIWLKLLFLATGVAILASFVWLFFHNQAQTEYTIHYDLWRSFARLAGDGSFKQYLFHFVHTYAITSLIWYLDVVFADGSLKLFHGVVSMVLIAAFAAFYVASIRFFRVTEVNKANAVVVTVIAMALWFSPSNSVGYTYPVVDILSSSLLLSLLLATLIVNSAADPGRSVVSKRIHWFGYLVVAIVGFFSLEPFLSIPLFLSLDAMFRRRFREALLHLLIAAVLVGLYFGLRDQPFLRASHGAYDRNLLAFLHNFLVFLSMHFLMLFKAFGLDPLMSTYIAITVSVLELMTLGVFALTHYRQKDSVADLSPRFALALATLGIVTITLAVWLRFSIQLQLNPIDRYTPYSVFFSMGTFLIASRTIVIPSGIALRFASIGVYVVTIGYLLAEASAFWLVSYNPAAYFAEARMEMAVYATDPGTEEGLGPSTHDEGLTLRSNLHSFLHSHGLSVFASPGFQAIGKPLPSQETSGKLHCKLLKEDAVLESRPQVRLIAARIDGAIADGAFVAADERGIIVAFGFSMKTHPADRTVQTLLPRTDDRQITIHYVKTAGSELVAAVPCQ